MIQKEMLIFLFLWMMIVITNIKISKSIMKELFLAITSQDTLRTH